MGTLTIYEPPAERRRWEVVRRSQTADDLGRREGHRQGGRKGDVLVGDMVVLAVIGRYEESKRASTRGRSTAKERPTVGHG
jgi:hypothetical protein